MSQNKKISLKHNVIFTDGRYIGQIKEEVDQKNFKIFDVNSKDPISWLKERIKAKEKILVDSWLFTSKNFHYIKKIIEKRGCEILLSKEIFIDKIWKKKNKINSKIFIREKKYSGISGGFSGGFFVPKSVPLIIFYIHYLKLHHIICSA